VSVADLSLVGLGGLLRERSLALKPGLKVTLSATPYPGVVRGKSPWSIPSLLRHGDGKGAIDVQNPDSNCVRHVS